MLPAHLEPGVYIFPFLPPRGGVVKKMISEWFVEKKIGNNPFLVKFVEKNAKWPLGGVWKKNDLEGKYRPLTDSTKFYKFKKKPQKFWFFFVFF